MKGPKVTAFVAFNPKHGCLGPYWFESGDKTVTVNAVRYMEVIEKFYEDLTTKLTPGQIQKAWLMQDGAPPHTAHDTIALLHERFNDRLIALGTTHEWAPHSPDLNPLDFWLWGAAKGCVFANKPKTLDQLKINISSYIRDVTPETSWKVGQNFAVRIKACLNRNGGHIENINFKKYA